MELTEKALYNWIGSRLRELRIERGIKQTDLAEKLNKSQSYLSRIEDGQKCSTYLLCKILHHMGCTLRDLDPESLSQTQASTLTINGSLLNSLPDARKSEVLSKIKESFRLLLSSDFWDEIIAEEERRSCLDRNTAPENQNSAEQPQQS